MFDYNSLKDDVVAILTEFGTPITIQTLSNSSTNQDKPWETSTVSVSQSIQAVGVFVNSSKALGKNTLNKDLLSKATSFLIASCPQEQIEKLAAFVINNATNEKFRVVTVGVLKPLSTTLILQFALAT